MIKNTTLPPSMEEKLVEVKRRRTNVEIRTAGLLGLMAFLGCMLTALAIDWSFVLFSPTIRSLLTITTFATAAITAIAYASRVLAYRSNWDRVAAEVDEETPILQERWMTVTNLTTKGAVSVDGRFLQRVTDEAAELESHVDPEKIVSSKWKRPATAIIACLVVAFLVLLCMDVQKVGILTMRFFAPTKNISLTRLRSDTPVVAARHEPLFLDATMDGRNVDRATLSIRREDEAVDSQVVFTSDATGLLRHRLKSVDQPFSYRWRAGDGQTKWFDVVVADRPELAAVTLQVTPPEYTGRAQKDWNTLPKRISIPHGSRVVVRVLPAPTSDIEMVRISDSLPERHGEMASQNGWFEWTTTAENDFEISPVLAEVHGLTSRRRTTCRVRVQPDRSPVVTIVDPPEDAVAAADDEIEIAYRAKDDHGIAKAELLLYREDEATAQETIAEVIPLPLPADRPSEVEGKTYLDLEQFELAEGESISYSIRVYDSRDQATLTDATQQPNSGEKAGSPPDDDVTAVDPADDASPPTSDDPPTDTNTEPSSRVAKSLDDPIRDDQSPKRLATRTPLAANEQTPDADSAANTDRDLPVETPPMASTAESQPNSEPTKMQAPPPPQIGQRRLDVGQSAETAPVRIRVDSTIANYKSEQRRKLEIAIAPVLKQIDRLLVSAASQTNRVWKDLDQGSDLAREHDRALSIAVRDVKAASYEVDDLLGQTTGTPYAFVGLQIADIRDSHIDAANGSLSTALSVTGNPRRDASRDAWQSIRRAQERLGQLSARFERVQRELKLADDVKRIKKMYSVAVEDSLALLRMAQDEINRYERNPVEFELDDEYLKRLQQVLEMRRDLRAELAKILAEDPRLMRRFSLSLRGQTDNLRDQMTLLVERQKDLTAELERWHLATEEEQPSIASAIWGKRLGEATDVSLEASELFDKFETWLPLDMAVPSVEKARRLAAGVAADARHLSDLANKTFDAENVSFKKPSRQAIDALLRHGHELTLRLRELDLELRSIRLDQQNQRLSTHILNRLSDARRLAKRHGVWLQRIKQLHAGDYSRMLSTEQRELAADTSTLTEKLRDLEKQLVALLQTQALPDDLADLSQTLIRNLDDEVSPAQLSTAFALRQQEIVKARRQADAAAATMINAEDLMDQVFLRAIEELDKLPVQDPISSLLQDPTLDEILAMLENEPALGETLGIPLRPSNLRIVSDWMNAGGNGGGGVGSLLRSQNEEQRRLLANAYRNAMRRASQGRRNATSIASQGTIAEKEVRWNTLVSKLSDRLLQGDGDDPPERYRKAINQYFDRVSRLTKEDVEDPNQ